MSDAAFQCPVCGASSAAGSDDCWLCHQAVPLAEPVDRLADDAIYTEPFSATVDSSNPFAPPATVLDESSTVWSTVMVVVMLLVVCGGLATAAPGLGIPLSILVTPAFIRSVIQVNRRREAGEQLTEGEKVGVFFASLAAVVTAATAAGVAFFATCVATCFGVLAVGNVNSGSGPWTEVLLFVPAVLVGLLAGGLVLRRFWKRRSLRR